MVVAVNLAARRRKKLTGSPGTIMKMALFAGSTVTGNEAM